MSNFHANAEKKMKEWKAKSESNEKKIHNVMRAAVQEIKLSKLDQDELKKKYMESQMKNARISAESKQNAKNAEYLQQQLLHNRTAESTIVSEAMRLVGMKCNVNNPLDQSSSKDNGDK